MTAPHRKMMTCEAIEATTATQVRTKLHKDVIEMYQEDIENGAKMPAIVVFAEVDSARHILADGFHRLLATINAGKAKIMVELHEGGMHDALEYALSANRTHGVRRTNSDKVNAVKLALKDPEFSQRTQQEIADLCGVSRKTVSRVSLKDTVGESQNGTKSQKPEDNKPENNRPTKPEPTQDEVERAELRMAMQAIKAFPYPGSDVMKLGLDPDDIADLEYVSTWAAHAVLAYRNGGESDG